MKIAPLFKKKSHKAIMASKSGAESKRITDFFWKFTENFQIIKKDTVLQQLQPLPVNIYPLSRSKGTHVAHKNVNKSLAIAFEFEMTLFRRICTTKNIVTFQTTPFFFKDTIFKNRELNCLEFSPLVSKYQRCLTLGHRTLSQSAWYN